MDNLIKYVMDHTLRGDCQCGQCITNSVKEKPIGHVVNMTFFKIGLKGKPNAKTLKIMSKENNVMPTETEISYITLGSKIGGQDAALRYMALGHLLGLWEVLSPDTMMPFLEPDVKMKMAQSGLISIKLKARRTIKSYKDF